MGKTTRWFRNLLGLKPNPNPTSKPSKDKQRRWSFVKSYREKSNSNPPPDDVATTSSTAHYEAIKHAIAVAAATAAVAEAAVAAAQAAAAVVRLTHSGPPPPLVPPRVSGGWERRVWAAVVIQSRFRGYLARRALRALKGLVKLQALVRGHIMRRKTVETMRCMHAMLRAQARARTVRAYLPESPQSSSKSGQLPQPEPPTPEKFVRATSAKQDQSPKIKRHSSRSSSPTNTTNQDRSNIGSSWSDPRMEDLTYDPRITSSSRTCKTDEDRADRILEIDTGRPPSLRRRTLFESHHHSGLLTSDHLTHSYTTSKDSHPTVRSPSVSCEVVQSLNSIKFLEETDDGYYCTAENSPQFNSAKSDGSRSLLSGYSGCPSYMSYTESSRAKVRSLSAPKQRPHNERPSSTKRYYVHGLGEHNPRSSRSRSSAMQASFTSKAYPGSGCLDRLGMPVRDSTVVYYSGYLN